MKKVLIAEDDVLISEELNDILINAGYEVVGIAEDFETAVEIIDSTPPEIALLDINMDGKEQGFDIAHYLNQTISIPFIFISSYSDSKTLQQAGDLVPCSYITKPFSKEQVISAIKIACSSPKEAKEHIVISDGSKDMKVNLDDILWIKADGVYIELQTTKTKILLRTSIKSFLDNYKTIKFTQIHRSYLVNMNAITSVSNNYVTIGNMKLPMSRSCKEDTINAFKKK